MAGLDEALLLNLIEQVYDAALDPARWAVFLDSLADAFQGGSALFSQDMRNDEAGIAQFARFDPDYLAQYVAHHSETNPWLRSAAGEPEGTLIVGQQRLDTMSVERTEFYNDWLRPQHLFETVGTILLKTGTVTTNITVLRGYEPGVFSRYELEFWSKLMPHVRRAVQVHRELFSVRSQRDSALQALNGLALGVMIVDETGRLLFSNNVAERVLSSGVGLSVHAGRLRGETPDATRSLQDTIRAAARTGSGHGRHPGGAFALPTRSGGSIPVLVSPLRRENELFQLGCPAALVFISDPNRKTITPEGDLMRVYGLTRAEARLLCGLLEGLSLNEYADRSGVSIGAVRSQLKQVFAKTGSSRQSDLVRMALRNPVLQMGQETDEG